MWKVEGKNVVLYILVEESDSRGWKVELYGTDISRYTALISMILPFYLKDHHYFSVVLYERRYMLSLSTHRS